MASILTSLQNTVIAAFVLAALVLLFSVASLGVGIDHAFGAFVFRWLHVVSGVMWIGLLWYFNFVQMPSMPKIPDEQKPAVGKVNRARGAVLVPLGGDGHHHYRHHSCGHERLSGRRLNAGRELGLCGIQEYPDRSWHVAGHDHVVQRLVRDLAKPAKGAEHR